MNSNTGRVEGAAKVNLIAIARANTQLLDCSGAVVAHPPFTCAADDFVRCKSHRRSPDQCVCVSCHLSFGGSLLTYGCDLPLLASLMTEWGREAALA